MIETAPTGFTFVCTACGKHNRIRGLLGDESCYLNAQLCFSDSLKFNADGLVTFARAYRGAIDGTTWNPSKGNTDYASGSTLAD